MGHENLKSFQPEISIKMAAANHSEPSLNVKDEHRAGLTSDGTSGIFSQQKSPRSELLFPTQKKTQRMEIPTPPPVSNGCFRK